MSEKPEALRLADKLSGIVCRAAMRGTVISAAAELRRQHAENEALTAIRDMQASMLRRLEERETELDAEIGRLTKENERLREALEKIATVNAMDYEYVRWAKAALRREG